MQNVKFGLIWKVMVSPASIDQGRYGVIDISVLYVPEKVDRGIL